MTETPTDPGRGGRRWPWLAAPAVVVAVVVAGGVATLSGSPASKPRPIPPSSTVPTSTTVPPGSEPVTASWVVEENQRQGTPYWNITTPQQDHSIEGYADRVSAKQGDTVKLFVSTAASSFHVEAYRMGFYGGKGARLVWTSAETPVSLQAAATLTPGINMIEAHWTPSLSVTLDSTWVPGVYLLKLVGKGSQQQYVPLTVRDDASTATYLIQNAVTTWQAYNTWGGYDLYQGANPNGGSSFARRSRVVSFDRPYPLSFGNGAGDLIGNELPFIQHVEQLGLDVTYWTDVDLHEHPELLTRHKVLISLGHDEYWSTAMRDGVQASRDKGVNLMFLGANAMFRHIRFEPSPTGADRHQVDYKDTSDPLYGKDNAEVTVSWRDPPVPRPESTIIGDLYECNPVKADMVISDAGSWILAGTGLSDGAHVPGLVGSEYDRYQPDAPGPRNVEIVAHSPVACRGKPSYSDMTYYTAASGAGVFATGTNWWVSRSEDPFVARVDRNILAAFGAGPAGRDHPSVPNVGQLAVPSTGAPTGD